MDPHLLYSTPIHSCLLSDTSVCSLLQCLLVGLVRHLYQHTSGTSDAFLSLKASVSKVTATVLVLQSLGSDRMSLIWAIWPMSYHCSPDTTRILLPT